MTGADASNLDPPGRTDLYHGIFRWDAGRDGRPRVTRDAGGPAAVPCPTTGRPLRIATAEAGAAAICPSCGSVGFGGFVSFDGDLRMAYACPQCRQLVWLAGV
jgi:predicted RNA-binding Zn-ribbon protein involved in translation (DUF1610 family)